MLASIATALLLSIASLTSAQSIQPSSVPISTRQAWCQSQRTQCPILCSQTPEGNSATRENTCSADTLQYSCVCSAGNTPNASEFSQTLPFYICTERNTQCVAACGNNNQCADRCRSANPCGASNPTRINSTTASTMPATSGVTGAASTGTGGNYDSVGGPNSGNGGGGSGAIALDFGQSFGLATVAAGLFAGFALIL